MPQISVYIATSLDGYIATEDDSLDWLDEAGSTDEDYGFDRFLADVDALAMGRGTYDYIAHIDPLPFGERPVYVFTHRPPAARDGVTFWSVDPDAAVAAWDAAGLRRIYLDGGRLISSFLAAGYVDDLLLTRVPVLLGAGRPLFHPIDRRTDLELVDVETFASGLVNMRYRRT